MKNKKEKILFVIIITSNIKIRNLRIEINQKTTFLFH
jgi:hypothetical protein